MTISLYSNFLAMYVGEGAHLQFLWKFVSSKFLIIRTQFQSIPEV